VTRRNDVPESRTRQKAAYTPPPVKKQTVKLESPAWYGWLLTALFVIGLAWIVTYYVTSNGYPISAVGAWNMVIGFGIIGAGLAMATRWR
jgi:hypothetical protein